MARDTHLEKDGGQPILVTTDEQGSRIIDEDTGDVIRQSGGDHHDDWVAEYERGGWVVVNKNAKPLVLSATHPFAAVTEANVAELGRGYYSIGQRGVQDACVRDDFAPTPINEVASSLHLITNSYERSEAFRIDMQASYKAFGGGASASASFSRSLAISSKSVSLVLRKLITTTRIRILSPRLTDDARRFLRNHGPSEFLERYGDVFVNEATFGASLFITFHSEAESVRKAQEMRASISGKAGPVSGSVSASQSIFEAIAKEELFLDSYSTGALDAPPTGSFRADDDARLTALFAYFDGFEEKLKAENGGVGALRELGFMPLSMANGAPAHGLRDFKQQWKALNDASALREQVRQLQSVFSDAAEQPATQDARSQIDRGLATLSAHDAELDKFGSDIITDPVHAPTIMPLSAADLPTLPEYSAPLLDVRFNATFLGNPATTKQGGNGEMITEGPTIWLGDFWGEVASLDPPPVTMTGGLFTWGGSPATFSKSLWLKEPLTWRSLETMFITGPDAAHYSIAYKIMLTDFQKTQGETRWYRDGEKVEMPPNQWACGIAIQLLPKYGRELPA